MPDCVGRSLTALMLVLSASVSSAIGVLPPLLPASTVCRSLAAVGGRETAAEAVVDRAHAQAIGRAVVVAGRDKTDVAGCRQRQRGVVVADTADRVPVAAVARVLPLALRCVLRVADDRDTVQRGTGIRVDEGAAEQGVDIDAARVAGIFVDRGQQAVADRRRVVDRIDRQRGGSGAGRERRVTSATGRVGLFRVIVVRCGAGCCHPRHGK